MKESAKMRSQVALVACNGGCRNTSCGYGCIGCGMCVSICPFGAIAFNDNGVAQVDERLCQGCGACVVECPQGIIRLHDADCPIVIRCSNRDPGKVARTACQVSCIGCGICEKVCPSGAAQVANNLSAIDEELCLSCGMCAVKCPRHAIYDLRGILTSKA